MSKPTQTDQVKLALLSGELVTPAEAFKRGWGIRLSATIERIRRRDSWPIITTLTGQSRMAVYSLPDDWRPPVPAKTPDAKKPRR